MKKRYIPMLIVFLGLLAFYVFDLSSYFTFDTLRCYHLKLKNLALLHPFLTVIFFIFVYIAMTTFSIPVAAFMSLLGGYLFPMPLSAIYVVTAASIGASLLFLSARTFLRGFFTKKLGSNIEKMREGFKKNEVSYLLFLRFVPLFPFWAVNIGAALLNVSLKTFVWTTVVGIAPGALIYTLAGSGLEKVLDQKEVFDINTIFNLRLKIALVLLGCITLLPLVFNRIKNR